MERKEKTVEVPYQLLPSLPSPTTMSSVQKALLHSPTHLLALTHRSNEPLIQRRRAKVAQRGVLLRLLGAPLALESAEGEGVEVLRDEERWPVRIERGEQFGSDGR